MPNIGHEIHCYTCKNLPYGTKHKHLNQQKQKKHRKLLETKPTNEGKNTWNQFNTNIEK